MRDPVFLGTAVGTAVGTAMEQLLSTFANGVGHPFLDSNGGNDSFNGHNSFHRQPD